ncbi:hypothetical protein [Tenacibaculum amylolyticum]|uniref:hypothetical protein n=1 Tax=Tenacibaculum amylolyticum TaxID=104269 RepID=UPI0038958109
MSLQIQYSKKIAKELGKVAVYLPGEEINVGDIVQFPHGIGIFRTAPFGSFQKITDLESLGATYEIKEDADSSDSYQFTSENSVDFKFELGGKVATGIEELPSGKGKIKLSFSKKGAIFFYALKCNRAYINNILSLEKEIVDNGKEMQWDNTFLITSLTIAKKALVVQSISKNSEITLGGDIKGISTGKLELDANANISLEKQKGDMLIKDWSDDVTVFVDVMRFKKKTFGKKEKIFKSDTFLGDQPEFRIALEKVDLSQYI